MALPPIQEPLPEKGSIEATDPFSKAPPGYSLAVDNGNLPFGRPPEEVDPEKVLEKAIAFVEEPLNKDRLKKMLMAGVSVETLIEGFIIGGFQEGKFSLDAGLLVKSPLAMYIANMAEEELLPYKLFENDNALDEAAMSDKDFLKLMKANNPTMFSKLQELINADIRSGSSSLAKSEQANIEGFLKEESESV